MVAAVIPEDVYRCRESVVTREILGETLLVPISAELADMDNIFALNATGAYVWQRLDGTVPLRAISAGLAAEFDVALEQAWSDLCELVAELRDSGLVEKVS